MVPPHAPKEETLRSIPHYAPNELPGVPPPHSSTALIKPVHAEVPAFARLPESCTAGKREKGDRLLFIISL